LIKEGSYVCILLILSACAFYVQNKCLHSLLVAFFVVTVGQNNLYRVAPGIIFRQFGTIDGQCESVDLILDDSQTIT
jgi:hypothetical protein